MAAIDLNILPLFGYNDGERWHPGIGDPTVMGWLTVAAYFAAAVLALETARRISRGQGLFRLPQSRFWIFLAAVMVFLGINKQLDLQTWLTLWGKSIAKSMGWYERRRVVQAAFVVFVAASGLLLYRWLWALVRDSLRDCWLGLAGLFFIGCFVVIRAASFHHIDMFLRSTVAGVRMNWLLELGGILIIAAGAARQMFRLKQRPEGDAAGTHPVVC